MGGRGSKEVHREVVKETNNAQLAFIAQQQAADRERLIQVYGQQADAVRDLSANLTTDVRSVGDRLDTVNATAARGFNDLSGNVGQVSAALGQANQNLANINHGVGTIGHNLVNLNGSVTDAARRFENLGREGLQAIGQLGVVHSEHGDKIIATGNRVGSSISDGALVVYRGAAEIGQSATWAALQVRSGLLILAISIVLVNFLIVFIRDYWNFGITEPEPEVVKPFWSIDDPSFLVCLLAGAFCMAMSFSTVLWCYLLRRLRSFEGKLAECKIPIGSLVPAVPPRGADPYHWVQRMRAQGFSVRTDLTSKHLICGVEATAPDIGREITLTKFGMRPQQALGAVIMQKVKDD